MAEELHKVDKQIMQWRSIRDKLRPQLLKIKIMIKMAVIHSRRKTLKMRKIMILIWMREMTKRIKMRMNTMTPWTTVMNSMMMKRKIIKKRSLLKLLVKTILLNPKKVF